MLAKMWMSKIIYNIHHDVQYCNVFHIQSFIHMHTNSAKTASMYFLQGINKKQSFAFLCTVVCLTVALLRAYPAVYKRRYVTLW
jgi:uncharacterized membrane protein